MFRIFFLEGWRRGFNVLSVQKVLPLVVQQVGGQYISPLGGAFQRDQNRTIRFGLLVQWCGNGRLSKASRFVYFIIY